ncbi:MAG: hypothetical protein E6Q06_01800 [Candidatus Moraniibacteriota bacterium]|nr:MAG: hypothetical protein E6Q06_01800 [Candidatus Moranbacteria bacterium]
MFASLLLLLATIALAAGITQAQYIKPNLADDDQRDFVWTSRKTLLVDAWLKLFAAVGTALQEARNNTNITLVDVSCSLGSMLKRLTSMSVQCV